MRRAPGVHIGGSMHPGPAGRYGDAIHGSRFRAGGFSNFLPPRADCIPGKQLCTLADVAAVDERRRVKGERHAV